MSETELNKRLKKKMAICVILQRKFSCRCSKTILLKATNEDILFCDAVLELYKECQNL